MSFRGMTFYIAQPVRFMFFLPVTFIIENAQKNLFFC